MGKPDTSKLEEKFHKKMREIDEARNHDLDARRRSAYIVFVMAIAGCALSCGSGVYLVMNHVDEMDPYESLMWIVAVLMGVFGVCALCCAQGAIRMFNMPLFPIFFFNVSLLTMGFFALFLSLTAMVVLFYNEAVKFREDTSGLKGIFMYGFIVCGFCASAFLCMSGIVGLRLSSFSKEKYMLENNPNVKKRQKVQWCPNLMPDLEKMEREAELRRIKKEDALPSPNIFEAEEKAYLETFQGVIDLQQGENDQNEIDFFQLKDLPLSLPNVDKEWITGLKSTRLTVEIQPVLQDAKYGGNKDHFKGNYRLLPAKQMRTEGFFDNLWGTALALALLRSKLPSWIRDLPDEVLSRIPVELQVEEVQQKKFDQVIRQTMEAQVALAEQLKQSRHKHNEDQDGENDEVQLEVEESEKDEEDEEQEVRVERPTVITINKDTPTNQEDERWKLPNGRNVVFWIEPVEKAVIFMCTVLFELNEKNHEMVSTAVDWYEVARSLVEIWEERFSKKALRKRMKRLAHG